MRLLMSLVTMLTIGCATQQQNTKKPVVTSTQKTGSSTGGIGSSGAADVLGSIDSTIQWNENVVLSADLTADSKEDMVFRGTAKDIFAIGIVQGPLQSTSQAWVIKLGVGKNTQDSLCGTDAQVTTADPGLPLDELGCGGNTPSSNCASYIAADRWVKENPNTSGLRIDDGKCDSFHVFWSPSTSQFEWWRL